MITVPAALLKDTFETFRRCGRGRNECQVLWLSSWKYPDAITKIVHPVHAAHGGGFQVSSEWLNKFWLDLARQNLGVRVQIHTHPGLAFHSETDNQYPMVHSPGFLSLVIPTFGMGAVSLARAYLAEIQPNGDWSEIDVDSRLVVQ